MRTNYRAGHLVYGSVKIFILAIVIYLTVMPSLNYGDIRADAVANTLNRDSLSSDSVSKSDDANYYAALEERKKESIKAGRDYFESLLSEAHIDARYGDKQYQQLLFAYTDLLTETGQTLQAKDPKRWMNLFDFSISYWEEFVWPEESIKIDKINSASVNYVPNAITASYNRANAVNYAHSWCGSVDDDPFYSEYNPAYRPFDGDCTNFVSQCLKAGGLTNIETPSYASWYYYRNGSDSFDSNYDDSFNAAWTSVNSLYSALCQSGRGLLKTVPSQTVQVGDILQFKLPGSSTYNHSVIITRIDTSPYKIYVSQHTSNRYDYALANYGQAPRRTILIRY